MEEEQLDYDRKRIWEKERTEEKKSKKLRVKRRPKHGIEIKIRKLGWNGRQDWIRDEGMGTKASGDKDRGTETSIKGEMGTSSELQGT